MYETYDDLVNYFENLINSIALLRGVTVGPESAVMDQQSTSIKYPHLWVQVPDATFVGTDENPAKRFRFALEVVTNEAKKTPKAMNAALSLTMGIAEQVWARLIADADAGLFDLVFSEVPLAAVQGWSADNGYGWRMDPVQIDLPRCECED